MSESVGFLFIVLHYTFVEVIHFNIGASTSQTYYANSHNLNYSFLP